MTTLLRKRGDMPHGPLKHCHGGKGSLDWIRVLDGDSLRGRRLRFVHDDVLPPGASIGAHRHETDEEYYYILSGTGVMTLDDRPCDVSAGDIAAVFPGGTHALENSGSGDLRLIVFSVDASPPESRQP